MPYIYTSFYEGHSCNKYMFVDAWVPEQQVPPIVDDFVKDKGAKTFFLIGSDYAFGRGMLGFTRKAYIEKTGGKVVGEEYLPMDGSDWTPIITKLKDANPDAHHHLDRGRRAQRHADQADARRGHQPALRQSRRRRRHGEEHGRRRRPASTSRRPTSPASTRRRTRSSSRRHAEEVRRRPQDAERPLGAGIRGGLSLQGRGGEGGSTDAAKVLEALPTVSFTGPRGMIKMNKEHHAPLTMYLGQVQGDGTVKVVGDLQGRRSRRPVPEA